MQKHLQILQNARAQIKKVPESKYTERFLIALDHLQQLQDIQNKRLEKLQRDIAKQSQPSIVAKAEEIFDSPRPQVENLGIQQGWLINPIKLVEECCALYPLFLFCLFTEWQLITQRFLQQLANVEKGLEEKIGELQGLLREMERKELMQLNTNIAKLQKTLHHQTEEITKQDNLNQLKFISTDLTRQENDLKVYQHRLTQYHTSFLLLLILLLKIDSRRYIDRAHPLERDKLMKELRSTSNHQENKKDLRHVHTVRILLYFYFINIIIY